MESDLANCIGRRRSPTGDNRWLPGRSADAEQGPALSGRSRSALAVNVIAAGCDDALVWLIVVA